MYNGKCMSVMYEEIYSGEGIKSFESFDDASEQQRSIRESD